MSDGISCTVGECAAGVGENETSSFCSFSSSLSDSSTGRTKLLRFGRFFIGEGEAEDGMHFEGDRNLAFSAAFAE